MPKKSPKSKKKVADKKETKSFDCPHCAIICKNVAGLKNHLRAKHADAPEKPPEDKGKKGYTFTPQQTRFCELYASVEEFFGNGVQSYIEAYNVKVGKGKGMTSYETCRFRAHELLKNPKILNRINEVFEGRGLNDAFVDKQLEKLITQDAEFNPKIRAIQEYNKLKKRTVDTVQHQHVMSDIKNMSDEELAAEKERLQNFFNKK